MESRTEYFDLSDSTEARAPQQVGKEEGSIGSVLQNFGTPGSKLGEYIPLTIDNVTLADLAVLSTSLWPPGPPVAAAPSSLSEVPEAKESSDAELARLVLKGVYSTAADKCSAYDHCLTTPLLLELVHLKPVESGDPSSPADTDVESHFSFTDILALAT